MNKGIYFLVLMFSFTTFGQDVVKQRIIKKLCGQITGSTNNYTEDNVETKPDGSKCYTVQCEAETVKNGTTHTSTHKRVKCISESEQSKILLEKVNTEVEVDVNTDPNAVTLTDAHIITLCKSGNCPKGYSINFDKGIITGPGSFRITFEGGRSTGGDGDLDIPDHGGIVDQGGSFKIDGKGVSYSSFVGKCIKVKYYGQGWLTGWMTPRSRKGKLKKVKVRPSCAKYGYSVSNVGGVIVISGNGATVSTRTVKGIKVKKEKSEEPKIVYVKKKTKGSSNKKKSRDSKVVVEVDGDIDGELIFVGDEDDDLDTRRKGKGGSSKYVWVHDGNTQTKCEYTKSWRDECLGQNQYNKIISMHGETLHCINCENNQNSRTTSSTYDAGSYGRSAGGVLNGIANIFGSVAPSVFGYLSTKASANAAVSIAEQCASMQNSYQTNAYSFIQDNEITVTDPTVSVPDCNGYSANSYAGANGYYSNGYGGFTNPYTSSGYTNGYLGNYSGMYSQYGNPYTSYMNGSTGLGLSGSLGLGTSGLGTTGWGTNGYGTTGYGLNGYGTTGYGTTGLGYSLNGSANGIVPWGTNTGSYYNGTTGNTYNNYANINQGYQSNQQAQAQGSYYQQQALANQAQTANQNYYNYGNNYGTNSYTGYSPSYSPSNFGLNWNFNAGF